MLESDKWVSLKLTYRLTENEGRRGCLKESKATDAGQAGSALLGPGYGPLFVLLICLKSVPASSELADTGLTLN